ncbi:N-acetyltransferase [Jannaschia pagri]|uniref:N-acetyltransferase n=1 Tax=Jannaschia pagri TaxID=2829797 RepID=A0ABQ4NHW2_9RHOB|nr:MULTISPECIES: GNAT family N-acetyltransferase [unclassified Jannaschia]GIT90115.1 N-acetyltransferase [Jannaschia sp. AI_61]GIT93779.1 N-acetyltransferase [Jannaschia sp. AI_62]
MDGITIRDLVPGDVGWVLQRHGELYWRDEGYDSRFEVLVARVLADFLEGRQPLERAWIAIDTDGVRQGCIFCTRPAPDTAKLRLFLVEPSWRGTGLAQCLLECVIDHARTTEAQSLVLWTHESHRAAGRLYRRNGFILEAQRPVDAFGLATMEQNWRLPL